MSVVSHGQGSLVAALLKDLAACATPPGEVILTLNIAETLPFSEQDFCFPLVMVRNAARKGFGENHNAAFRRSRGGMFCVLNPDIRLEEDPFPALVSRLQDLRVGVVAPLIVNPQGEVEDSARRFPTPLSILGKALGAKPAAEYEIGSGPVFPDWVAGMFMVFRREVFESLGGFDERYFLYYEDVDLCARLRAAGFQTVLEPGARAIHQARRESHRNWRYRAWHLRSMLRFFLRQSLRSGIGHG